MAESSSEDEHEVAGGADQGEDAKNCEMTGDVTVSYVLEKAIASRSKSQFALE